jgi:hypothetical protein
VLALHEHASIEYPLWNLLRELHNEIAVFSIRTGEPDDYYLSSSLLQQYTIALDY